MSCTVLLARGQCSSMWNADAVIGVLAVWLGLVSSESGSLAFFVLIVDGRVEHSMVTAALRGPPLETHSFIQPASLRAAAAAL